MIFSFSTVSEHPCDMQLFSWSLICRHEGTILVSWLTIVHMILCCSHDFPLFCDLLVFVRDLSCEHDYRPIFFNCPQDLL
jgi:hypothetical protein